MQLQTYHFDGVPYIANPYRKGSYLREDAFWRQFHIICEGEFEYPEDDPTYGTYWSSGTMKFGQCGLITQAMNISQERISQQDFVFSDESEALDFRPYRLVIYDTLDRLVLAGHANTDSIEWCIPVESDTEADLVRLEVRQVLDQASEEGRWDNYCTVQGLRRQATVIQGRLVDRFWREHAKQAILQATESA